MAEFQPNGWPADLHIHSRFSRATARNLEPLTLARWAGVKGLRLIGSGDLTHPGWLAELRDKLTPAGDGLLRLADSSLPGAEVRFLLTGEISCIYKKSGAVRKVHLVVLMPSFEAAERFNDRLGRIGNLLSDGRPILGLDAKSVLELVLETDPLAELIPAHIWTPWFSVLGSKSGFDSLEECFDELTDQVHAVETGLSSDPPMNRRVGSLDRFHLVSSSDAHSPANLAREATVFSTGLSYPELIQALRTGRGLEGTLEFFPEEGKYHLDGHRKCNQRLEPARTRALNGICPVCGRPVTVGVLNRVEDLADRTEAETTARPPATDRAFEYLIPLAEILSQVLGKGPKTKTVTQVFDRLIHQVGPELTILRQAPLEDLRQTGGELLAEAVNRLRQGRVDAQGGFDGEFGLIRLFSPEERDEIARQGRLFTSPGLEPDRPQPQAAAPQAAPAVHVADEAPRPGEFHLSAAQQAAVEAPPGPVAVLAGPGSGKTAVLTRRLAALLDQGAEPERIAALTFTRKAAGEMKARLLELTGEPGGRVRVCTFHALGAELLADWGLARAVIEDEERQALIRGLAKEFGLRPGPAGELLSRAKLAQVTPEPVDDLPPELARAYDQALNRAGVYDFDDLLVRPAALVRAEPDKAAELAARFDHLLVDEFQDLNRLQFDWLSLLAPEPEQSLFVVGDPDQAIYGFRGASPRFFRELADQRPGIRTFNLAQSFRSPASLLRAARELISRNPGPHLELSGWEKPGPALLQGVFATPVSEAVGISREVERLLGGSSHLAMAGHGIQDGPDQPGFALADIAVLTRLHSQAVELARVFDQAGLPYQLAGDQPGRETDALELGAEKISLLTIHAAKGLEFPVVFLAGAQAGLLPYQPPDRDSGFKVDIEEERRLLFVALTRAERRFYLTRSRKTSLHGRGLADEPSPFLAEIPGELLQPMDIDPVKPKGHVQLELF